jgi:glycosyltransferase involved in cell wall biosynthesis
MLAPEPFFEPRGTPFSEYHRIKALGELGYAVDLVTYPFGRDVELPNLRIVRCLRPPFVRGVRIGPSVVKILLDAMLALTAFRLAVSNRYHAVHSHEEAGVLGLWLAKRLGIPHLYDMHSSLPQQLVNFGYTRSALIRQVFERIETTLIDKSRVIITICPDLQRAAVGRGAGARAFLIENVMGGDVDVATLVPAHEMRARYGLNAKQPVVLYTGTFEAYQGIDMLMEAAVVLGRTHPDARVLVVGGTPTQVQRAREQAARYSSSLVFTGQRPPQDIPSLVAACDILVSPRISGTNTPLKIYSYLRSGRPIVATDLQTHTQVLSAANALLVPPDASALAAGMARLIDCPEERARLAESARTLAASQYSRESYVSRTATAYKCLLGQGTSAGRADAPRSGAA